MQFTTVLFLLIGSSLCLALAQVCKEDCCLEYVRELDEACQKQVRKYRRQVLDGDCNLDTVIFTMRRGREICTDPKEKWVSDLMKEIDEKRKLQLRRKKTNKSSFWYEGESD